MEKKFEPTDILTILLDGLTAAKEASEYEDTLNEELDKKVLSKEINEHEARKEFREKLNSFLERKARQTAKRVGVLDESEPDEVDAHSVLKKMLGVEDEKDDSTHKVDTKKRCECRNPFEARNPFEMFPLSGDFNIRGDFSVDRNDDDCD